MAKSFVFSVSLVHNGKSTLTSHVYAGWGKSMSNTSKVMFLFHDPVVFQSSCLFVVLLFFLKRLFFFSHSLRCHKMLSADILSSEWVCVLLSCTHIKFSVRHPRLCELIVILIYRKPKFSQLHTRTHLLHTYYNGIGGQNNEAAAAAAKKQQQKKKDTCN